MTAETALFTVSAHEQQRDALIEQLLSGVLGAFDVFGVYLGDKLGFYEAIRERGAISSPELARATRTQERYAREWLEQQTTRGILTVDDARLPMTVRRYSLPAAHAEVLAEPDSLNYLAPIAQVLAGAVHPLEKVVNAYRSGGGVSFGEYGADMRAGQARMNRAAFLKQLGQQWLPSIADVHQRLSASPAARVADIGCGCGWSSIGMAQNYPGVRIDGFDTDTPSVAAARQLASDSGLSRRVSFHASVPDDEQLAGVFDLVTAFECVHDMGDPVGALRTMRRIRQPDGAVIVMDERVDHSFTGQAGDVEALTYGWSMLHCLPAGMSESPSAGTGTVMRLPQLEAYAREAGFESVEVPPIDNYFFRFYRLRG